MEIGIDERCDKRAACPVDVQGYVPPFRLLYVNEKVIDFLDRVHLSGKGGSQNRGNAYGVLVNFRSDFIGADDVRILLEWDQFQFHVEVACALLPYRVDVCPHHDIRVVARLSLCLSALSPGPLVCQYGEHNGF